MNNYEFCAQWVLDRESSSGIRVLDYGCGAGQIVKDLREQNVNAYGCDVFYEGGDYSKSIGIDLFKKGIIRKMTGITIPFDCASFDIVINNQVMEHVVDLDSVLAEMNRVMKPGGVILSLFPDKWVFREGHCGIPFLHWFPKTSRTRVYYAAGLRILGFGYHKGTKSVMRWSQDFCNWLDLWTHYRTRKEINATFGKYFRDIEQLEPYWLQQRLGGRKYVVSWLPSSIQKCIARRLGCMVFIAHKTT